MSETVVCADMNVYYKNEWHAQWEEFKKRISDGKEEDEDMTLDTFKGTDEGVPCRAAGQ